MTLETASDANRFKAIVFDLDGTLLNTLNDIADAMNRVLVDNGLPSHPVDRYKYFVGDGLQRLIERALPEKAATPEAIPTYLKAFRAAYARNWHASTRPYPGIPSLLDRLVALDIRLAVLSNKAHEFTVQMVSTLLKPWHFQPVVGARADFPKKPNPQPAWHVLAGLNVAGDACLLVGDSGVDMQTATAAGLFPVGVTWGFRPEAELRANGCRFVARQPRDILQLF